MSYSVSKYNYYNYKEFYFRFIHDYVTYISSLINSNNIDCNINTYFGIEIHDSLKTKMDLINNIYNIEDLKFDIGIIYGMLYNLYNENYIRNNPSILRFIKNCDILFKLILINCLYEILSVIIPYMYPSFYYWLSKFICDINNIKLLINN
jgi:hypothetical protein